MGSVLESSLADEITAALGAAGVPYAVTVTRSETTGGDPFDPGSGTTTTTDYTCKGWRDEYRLEDIDGTLIKASDVRVLILQSSLDITPTTSDTVTVGGTTYTIIDVTADPAGALWDVQGRT